MKCQFKARLHHNSIVTQESYLQYKNFKDGCICHQTPYTGLFVNLYMNFSFYLLNLLLCTHFTLCTRSSSLLFFCFQRMFQKLPQPSLAELARSLPLFTNSCSHLQNPSKGLTGSSSDRDLHQSSSTEPSLNSQGCFNVLLTLHYQPTLSIHPSPIQQVLQWLH